MVMSLPIKNLNMQAQMVLDARKDSLRIRSKDPQVKKERDEVEAMRLLHAGMRVSLALLNRLQNRSCVLTTNLGK